MTEHCPPGGEWGSGVGEGGLPLFAEGGGPVADVFAVLRAFEVDFFKGARFGFLGWILWGRFAFYR